MVLEKLKSTWTTWKLDLTLHINQFKWIKALNVRCETLKPLEENMENTAQYSHRKDFLNRTPTAQKEKNGQMGLHQIKKLLHSKGNNRVKRQPTE
jgi:hypothetical protein